MDLNTQNTPLSTEEQDNSNLEQQEYSYTLNGEPVYENHEPFDQKQRKRINLKPLLLVIIALVVLVSRIFPGLPRRLLVIQDGSTFGSTVSKLILVDDGSESNAISNDPDDRGTVHYAFMLYTRPDVDGMLSKIDHIISVCSTLSYDELLLLLDEVYEDYWHFDTMYWLADTKSCTDVTDEYYYDECVYLNAQSPIIDQKIDEMLYALAASPHCSQLDKEYYGGDYLIYYTGESYYNDELVALYQREAELILEYQTLIGAPTIEIDGETVYVEDYLNTYADDSVKYYAALELYYNKYGKLAGEIYVELIKTRHQIAAMTGYDSYIDYAYDDYSRDYTPDDVREYVSTVCLGIVPLYLDMYYSGELYDYYLPGSLTPEENNEALRQACREMGGRVWDIYQYMERNGLFDIEVSGVKANMSFQTYFEDWQAPFILLDATGTFDDYTGFSHEFGHFIDAYINYNSYITTDASESCSQSMEFLAIIYSSYFGTDSEILKEMKMTDLVTLYTEQGAYNAFEEAVYAIPVDELTPERIRQTAHDVFMQYGLIVPGDDPMYDNMWIDIPHFFSNPFYIVSYIISNDAAFQIYEQEMEEPGKGIDTFIALCDRDWDLNYLENMENIGLDASFSIDRANAIVNTILNYFE